MKRFLLFALIMAAVIPFYSCRKGRTEDRVIAVVNGEQVFESEFAVFRKICRLRQGPGATQPQADSVLLREFIERKIVLCEAKKLNIQASPDREAKNDGGEAAGGFAEELERQGLSLKDWKLYSDGQAVFEKTIYAFAGEIITGEDEIKAYYASHLKDFSRGEQAHAYQIVSANAAAAENIRKELERGAEFEAMARSRSVAPDKENGGDLGFVSPEDLPAEMSAAVFKTEPGRLSAVTKSDYGFHIFLVKEKRKKGAAKLDEVRPLIEERIRRAKAEKALAAKLKELGGATNVKINKACLEEFK